MLFNLHNINLMKPLHVTSYLLELRGVEEQDK